jgi:hypothetical protein
VKCWGTFAPRSSEESQLRCIFCSLFPRLGCCILGSHCYPSKPYYYLDMSEVRIILRRFTEIDFPNYRCQKRGINFFGRSQFLQISFMYKKIRDNMSKIGKKYQYSNSSPFTNIFHKKLKMMKRIGRRKLQN